MKYVFPVCVFAVMLWISYLLWLSPKQNVQVIPQAQAQVIPEPKKPQRLVVLEERSSENGSQTVVHDTKTGCDFMVSWDGHQIYMPHTCDAD